MIATTLVCRPGTLPSGISLPRAVYATLSNESVCISFVNGSSLMAIAREQVNQNYQNVVEVPEKIFALYNQDIVETDCQISFTIAGAKTCTEVTIEVVSDDVVTDVQPIRKFVVSHRHFINGQYFTCRYGPGTKSQFLLLRILTDECQLNQLVEVSPAAHVRFYGKNVPKIADIGGNSALIDWFHGHYLFSIENRQYLNAWGIPIPRGLLLSGSPGTGKTSFARAISAECGLSFFEINAAEIIGPLVGEAERLLLQIFEDARHQSPSIVFIDEIESICSSRNSMNAGYENRIITVFLTQMDGLGSSGDILVIGATNKPELIDNAFLRPGRFGYRIEMNLPDQAGRFDILQIHAKKLKFSGDRDVILDEIARVSNGFSGAILQAVVHNAGIEAIREFKKLQTAEPMVSLAHCINAVSMYNKK